MKLTSSGKSYPEIAEDDRPCGGDEQRLNSSDQRYVGVGPPH
jgi:hypothetical protein